MVGIFESSVHPLFHPSWKKAENAILEEASITGALILTVTSVQISQKMIYLYGHVPRLSLQSRLKTPIKDDTMLCKISVSSNTSFHTTWNQILSHQSPIGYLGLYHPFQILEQGCASGHDTDVGEKKINIRVEFPKKGESLFPKIWGLHLCNKCGEEISAERLDALPGTVTCVYCSPTTKGGENGK